MVEIRGMPFRAVTLHAEHNGNTGIVFEGYTDARGSLVIRRIEQPRDIGFWKQTWFVGESRATPTLSFCVFAEDPGAARGRHPFSKAPNMEYNQW